MPKALLHAAVRVMHADDRWFVLVHELGDESERDSLRQEKARRLETLRKKFARFLPGVEVPEDDFVEFDQHRTAARALADALEADPEISPRDVLLLLDAPSSPPTRR